MAPEGFNPLSSLAEKLSVDMAVWATNSGDDFKQGTHLVKTMYDEDTVTEEEFDFLSAKGVHALIDGAFTDNTGIAHAVATGATEVVSLLNITDDESDPIGPKTLFDLFAKETASPE